MCKFYPNFLYNLYYTRPVLRDPAEFSWIDRELALNMGNTFIRQEGLAISPDAYADYFDAFEAQLLEHGDPEIRAGLYLWHEPSQQFVLYYAP